MAGLIIFLIIIGNVAFSVYLATKFSAMSRRVDDLAECVTWLGRRDFDTPEMDVVEDAR